MTQVTYVRLIVRRKENKIWSLKHKHIPCILILLVVWPVDANALGCSAKEVKVNKELSTEPWPCDRGQTILFRQKFRFSAFQPTRMITSGFSTFCTILNITLDGGNEPARQPRITLQKLRKLPPLAVCTLYFGTMYELWPHPGLRKAVRSGVERKGCSAERCLILKK